MIMLAVRNFQKKYSDRLILSVPAIDFVPGAYWIQGENGSGKSTFFKAIAGLVPHEGSVILDDKYSHRKTPKQYLQRLTYSEAEPLYPGFLTPRDLFSFVGNARGATKEEIYYFRDLFGIAQYYTSSIQSCSSGMIKRVSLALAFFGNPKVIILDEPLITLDAQAQAKLYELIKTKMKDRSTIILLSSHQWINDDLEKRTYVIRNQSLEAK